MASSKHSPSSFPSLLLSVLSLALFALSTASAAPTVLLRFPPTRAGAAFLAISAVSVVSALCSALRPAAHLSLFLVALAVELVGVLALFAREAPTLAALGSQREPRAARRLARLECGALAAMVLMQAAVLALSCVVRCCWPGKEEGEGGVEAAQRWSRRGVRVGEEPVGGAEARAAEIEEKLKGKYGHVQWVKTDFEG